MAAQQDQSTSSSTDRAWEEFFSVATAEIESISASSARARQRIERTLPGEQARAADQGYEMIAGIGEELVRRTDAVDAECRRIFEILERVAAQVAPNRGRGRGRSGVSEGVRLLATQMEMGGDSPQRIAERLESEFGVSDGAAVVAEVLHGRPGAA
jgi:hypothetical protein